MITTSLTDDPDETALCEAIIVAWQRNVVVPAPILDHAKAIRNQYLDPDDRVSLHRVLYTENTTLLTQARTLCNAPDNSTWTHVLTLYVLAYPDNFRCLDQKLAQQVTATWPEQQFILMGDNMSHSTESDRVEAEILKIGPGPLVEAHQLAAGLVKLVPEGKSLVSTGHGLSAEHQIDEEVKRIVLLHLDRIGNDMRAVPRDYPELSDMLTLIRRTVTSNTDLAVIDGDKVTVPNTAVHRARRYFGLSKS